MASRKNPVLKVMIAIVSAGLILFLAVFAGIQIGYAVKDGGDASSTAERPLSGRPSAGDPVPSLKLFTADGHSADLRDIVPDEPALIAFTMPGCVSCPELLSGWQADGILGRRGAHIIIVVVTPPGDFDAGDLSPFASRYSIYFCDNADLYLGLDIRGVPAVLGVTGDGAVSFFSDDPDSIRDTAFLARYL